MVCFSDKYLSGFDNMKEIDPSDLNREHRDAAWVQSTLGKMKSLLTKVFQYHEKSCKQNGNPDEEAGEFIDNAIEVIDPTGNWIESDRDAKNIARFRIMECNHEASDNKTKTGCLDLLKKNAFKNNHLF
jgi:hypothetical protein